MPVYLFSAPGQGPEIANQGIALEWQRLWPHLAFAHMLGQMTLKICGPGRYDVTPKYGPPVGIAHLSVDGTGEVAKFSVIPHPQAERLIAELSAIDVKEGGSSFQLEPRQHVALNVRSPISSGWVVQTVVKHDTVIIPNLEYATPLD